MSRNITKSDFVQKTVICKPYETTTVDFIDIRPNYYRVQNMGASRIYMGVSKMPTDHDYEFACKPESFAMYTEPHQRGYMYIYNPSGSEVMVRILAFAAEFDPLALAFSQIEIDFAGMQLQTLGAITEFQAPLPAGTNKIGSVEVSKLPALPAGSNVVGKFNVNNWPTDYAKAANQKDYTESILALKTLMENVNFSTGFIDNVCCWDGETITETVEINADINGKCYLHLLSNDGNTDFELEFTNKNNNQASIFTLKAGETIQDLKFTGKLYLKPVDGAAFAYRIMVSYD